MDRNGRAAGAAPGRAGGRVMARPTAEPALRGQAAAPVEDSDPVGRLLARIARLPLLLRLPALALVAPVLIVGAFVVGFRMWPSDVAFGLAVWGGFVWLALAYFGLV